MDACDPIRELLAAYDEGELGAAERARVEAHLHDCGACREELRAERLLTASLRRGSHSPSLPSRTAPPVPGTSTELRRSPAALLPVRRRLAAAAALALTLTGLGTATILLHSPPSYGSMVARTLTPTLSIESGPIEPLEDSNHLEIPSGATATIELEGTGTLTATGPAMFELECAKGRWKLVLLEGQVRAVVKEDSSLDAVTLHGRRSLGAGTTLVTLQPAFVQNSVPSEEGPAELLERGFAAFYGTQDFALAEQCLRAARDHEDATEDLRCRAHFYLSAALARADRTQEAADEEARFLELYPDDPSRSHVLLFLGIHRARLGEQALAEQSWRTLIEESPNDDLAQHAQRYLDGAEVVEQTGKTPSLSLVATALAVASQSVSEAMSSQGSAIAHVADERLSVDFPAAPKRQGGALVVHLANADRDRATPFRAAAVEIAKDLGAELFELRLERAPTTGGTGSHATGLGAKAAALEKELRQRTPDDVVFVVDAEDLDLRLHREILLQSIGIDEDVFPDFSFGYLTARDAEGVRAQWNRDRALHRTGIANHHWVGASVTSGMKSTVYPSSVPPLAQAAGFDGEHIYWSCVESDPAVRDFVGAQLPKLEKAGVVELFGCGDPQGIWLFEDRRNLRQELHWEFDPRRVGEDPDGAMPRILAPQFAALQLDSPIVWSGTCHSGATHRVFVESDIVSTFGKSNRVEVYELGEDESLCLAFLEAGAAAFLAPIGANHGMSVSREIDFAFEHGATLGETMKSTYDDVCLQAHGAPPLVMPERGRSAAESFSEPVMQGGGVNRALFGDPTLRPFPQTPSPSERTEVRRTKTGFEVAVHWDASFHARAWDMYGLDRGRDFCVGTRVAMDDWVRGKEAVRFTCTLEAHDDAGANLPYVLRHCEPEWSAGRPYLHLQANVARDLVANRAVEVVFRLEREKD